jgi:hypothetical protein
LIDILPFQDGDEPLVHVVLAGTLTQLEYNVFGPSLEAVLRPYAHTHLLFELEDGLRWEPRSMWRGLRLSGSSRTNLTKLAIVGGDKAWQGWLLAVCQPMAPSKMLRVSSKQKPLALFWLAALRLDPLRGSPTTGKGE